MPKIAPIASSAQNIRALIDRAPLCSRDRQRIDCTKTDPSGSYWIQRRNLGGMMARLLLTASQDNLRERRGMKASIFLSLLILAPTGYAASAGQFEPVDYADIDVVS